MLDNGPNNNSKKDAFINPNEGFYTNNPDDQMYTNNPDDENFVEPKIEIDKNKLFFSDDNDEKENNNPFLEDKDKDKIINIKESNSNIVDYNINDNLNIDNIKNNINKEEEENKPNNNELIELKDIDNEQKGKQEEIKMYEDLNNYDLTEEVPEEIPIPVNEDNNNNNRPILINENRIHSNYEDNKRINPINNQPKIVLQESDKSDNLILESLIRNEQYNKDEYNSNIKKIILAIIFGQILAMLSVANGFFVEKIQNEKELSIPLLISSSYYVLIFLFYFFFSKCKISKPKKIYIILSIIDTQANFFNIYIFSLIDFKFPYIINTLSTIWTVVFTLIMIRIYKYLKNHVIGIVICIIGVFAVLIGTFDGDSFNDFKEMFKSFNSELYGLFLCIIISMLYGLNVVFVEKFISPENDEIKSYCTWLGIFGFFISLIESFIPKSEDGFEFQILFSTKRDNVDSTVAIYWVLSALFLAILTAFAPFYIQKYQATMYNISLAFAIFWSFLVDYIFIKQKYEFHWFHLFSFFGFITIICGIVIFFWKDRIKRNDFSYS